MNTDEDWCDVTRAEQALFTIDPLFRTAGNHVDDFLHRRVAMKLVRPPRRHEHAHHQQLFGGSQPRSTQPLMRAPG